MAAADAILHRELRPNPAYELLPVEGMRAEQRNALMRAGSAPGYGFVLLPRGGDASGIKLVCRNTARLIAHLQCSGNFADETWAAPGLAGTVAGMVLDGILQMRHEGRFVSGAEAYGALLPCPAAARPRGRLARLADQALRYAEATAVEDPRSLSSRLYFFHRIPLNAGWRVRLKDRSEALSFLGGDSPRVRSLLRERWEAVEEIPGWFGWRGYGLDAKNHGMEKTYKLYISPRPEELPEVFGAALEVLSDSGACAFKAGSDAWGVLRPDKFIAYFADFDALQGVARRLANCLSGCPPHGVPFTAALTPDGLLSWGQDPAVEWPGLPWGRQSWRGWIADRLATALVTARRAERPAIGPAQFALLRLRFHGVDTESWSPSADFPGNRAEG